MLRRFLSVVALGLTFAAANAGADHEAQARPLVSEPSVTVYGATWCSACKTLERDLRDRSVPFTLVDVDQNARAYDVAKRATGKSVVPLTSVAKTEDDLVWFVGADADGIEKAYKGD